MAAETKKPIRISWFFSIVVSASAALVTEKLLANYPDAAELLSKIVGPIVKDLFPLFVAAAFGLDWILLWRRMERLLKNTMLAASFSLILVMLLSAGGLVSAGVAWSLGSDVSRIVAWGLGLGLLWLVVCGVIAAELLHALGTSLGKRACPQCGSSVELRTDHTQGGELDYVTCTKCSWPELVVSD